MKQLLLLLVLLFSYIIAEDDNSIELKSSDFDMITSKGTWFVKHYVPWCKHCKKLAPFWSQMSRDFAYLREKRKFFMAQINCDKEVELCKLHDIDAYPTLLLYKDGVLIEEFLGEVKDDKELKPYIQKMAEEMFLKNKDTPVENKVTSEKNVSNPSDKDKEKKEQEEIEKKEKEEKEKEKEEKERKEKEAKENKDSKKEDNKSKETTLENSEFSEETLKKDVGLMEKHEKTLSPAVTGSTFEHILSKGYTFVKYYAPWCGHCIHFRPTWLSLSHELSSYKKSKNLQMVQFDCDAESDFCRDHGVTGYPSLKLYKDGELIKGFTEFDRSLNNVKKWLLQTIEDEESGRMTIKKENKEKGSIPVEIQNVLKIDEKSEENINNGAWFVAFILKKGENDIDPFDEKWGVLAQEFEKFKDNYNTQLAYVDCGVDYELCKKYKVKAQVEIKLYLNGNWVENYSNSEFDMESIRVYIREKTSLISQNKLFANYYFKNERISNPDGKLMELNSENYELLVPTGNYFILFKTASCIKCKAIHSILQELAPDFVNSVNLATIYCDKNHELCQKLKVEKYPKLKYFKDGNPRDYHGLPNKEAINSFIISSRKPVIRIVNDKQMENLLKVKQNKLWLFIYETEQHIQKLKSFVKEEYLEQNIYLMKKSDAKNYPQIEAGDLKLFSDGKMVENNSQSTSIKQQLSQAQFQSLIKLDHNNIDIFMKKYEYICLSILKEENDLEINMLNEIVEEKKDQDGRLGFGYLNGLEFSEYVKRVYGKNSEDLPFYVITKPETSIVFDKDIEQHEFKFEKENILKNIDDALNNKLTSHSTISSSSISPIWWVLLIVILIGVFLFWVKKKKGGDDEAERKMLNQD